MRFKRDVGILPADNGPGLTVDTTSWSLSQGGTGFAPPYCFPKAPLAPLPTPAHDQAPGGEADSSGSSLRGRPAAPPLQKPAAIHGSKYGLASDTANKYLQSFTTRYAKPATVFCSRELEDGLTDYVRIVATENGGAFPSDEALRAKACEILGCTPQHGTPADDKVLLDKFKDMVRGSLATDHLLQASAMPTMPDMSVTNDMNLAADSIGTINSGSGNHEGDLLGNVHGNSLPLGMSGMDMDLNTDTVTQGDMDSLLQDISMSLTNITG